ncbi:hypothetical protein CAAN1_01S04984 [[Candida] anglica]|uniref:Histidinol-phosphatase n=1 Tax=[Candida] anglica TaxID=148631 RepID=A0ABP0ENP4_9ASCO
MHSHHSHSGDYVSHATDNLESIIDKAESMGFTHYCLTEHMPRLHDKFLYPEEIEKNYTSKDLESNFDRYVQHAVSIQQEKNSKNQSSPTTKIIVGLEVEGLNSEHIDYTSKLLEKYHPHINMTVGSVHYVNEIPIDFSPDLWIEARDSLPDKTSRSLFLQYFELQYEVLSKLKPTVVGHFDLIRLFEPSNEVDPTTGKLMKDISLEQDWPDVWELVVRNIKFVESYGGLFELNSAAIRKGWSSPYPKQDVSEAIVEFGGGRFCLSDDSHSIAQVGLNYHKVWEYIKFVLKLTSIYHLDINENGETIVAKVSVSELDKSPFWKQYI